MLATLTNGAELQAVPVALVDPKLPHLLHRLAGVGGSVRALYDFVLGADLPRLRRLFVREAFDVPLTMLIAVVNDPALFICSEFPFAYASHFPRPPSLAVPRSIRCRDTCAPALHRSSRLANFSSTPQARQAD